MYNFPIGVMVDSFRQDTREAIKTAASIGVKGLQMYSTTGENSPENLVGQKRKDLLNFVKDQGLVFSAICGDLGKAFIYADRNIELIEKSKRIMDLSGQAVSLPGLRHPDGVAGVFLELRICFLKFKVEL